MFLPQLSLDQRKIESVLKKCFEEQSYLPRKSGIKPQHTWVNKLLLGLMIGPHPLHVFRRIFLPFQKSAPERLKTCLCKQSFFFFYSESRLYSL